MFVAEVKIKSPFAKLDRPKAFDRLIRKAHRYGDMVSIHTDPKWAGKFEHITYASRYGSKPILAKGIHASDEDVINALNHGAAKVLVVGRIPDKKLLPYCWIEPLNTDQLLEFACNGVKTMVWNSRDLSTGGHKPMSFAFARMMFGGTLIQASNIKSLKDVDKTADGYIVGTYLDQFVKSLKS